MFVVNQQIGLFRQVFLMVVFGLLALDTAGAATGQTGDYSPAELEELVGPVALYPDDLIAIILPASSYPLQIVEAARYLKEVGKNPELKPDDDWDDAVVALLNYPEVIDLLNEDLDWTWNLGEAVVNQQANVLAAIQDFRSRAVAAGNLETDGRQTVSRVDDVIEVTPVDPEVIYVPYYEPARVVVYQREPVYHYYPRSYPLYYYPYPAHYPFASGFFWGVTTAYTVGWLTDRVHFHNYGHASHPYYGRHYTSHYYARRAGRVRHQHFAGSRSHFVSGRRHYGNTWKPNHRHGDRPGHKRAATKRRQQLATNFNGSARRHSRAGDERVRSGGERHTRARFRAGQDRKNVRSRATHKDNAPTRRGNRRRQADDIRTKTRVAVLDRSENRKPSRRNRTARSKSGGKRIIAVRNERPVNTNRSRISGSRTSQPKTSRRVVRKLRDENSLREKHAAPRGNSSTKTARRTETRAQPRRERRQDRRQAKNTKRSASKSRANAKPATAAPTRMANVPRSARSAGGRGQSRGGRSGKRGGQRK